MPRITHIIWTDWPALFCSLLMPLIWAISAGHSCFISTTKCDGAEIALLALPISAVAAGVLLWRCSRILFLFRNGTPALGTITMLQLVKDRGRLEFTYSLDGKEFKSWMPVHKNPRVIKLKVGQPITALVSSRAHTHAIVREAFI